MGELRTDALTEDDVTLVHALWQQVQQWLSEGHDSYRVNTSVIHPPIPQRVWLALVRRAQRGGCRGSLAGNVVHIDVERQGSST